tara:strand:- start:166 stop:549 length:384 start_codon:yes stop_codon:yes gene_type:complete
LAKKESITGEPFEKYDPQVSRARKMSGTFNLILITLLLVAAQNSQLLRGYELFAWGMMLWLGVANAALLNNYDSAWFRVQELVKSLVLFVLATQLSAASAILIIPLSLAGTLWQWFERETEEVGATS